jgi:thiol-disulfide isomerase/thioredoxin
MKPNTKSTLLDLLAGVMAALSSFTLLYYFSFPVGFMLMSPLPFIAGFIRGKDPAENRLIKTALMNSVFYVLVFTVLLGWWHYLLVIGVALTGTRLGIYARQRVALSKGKVLGFSVLFFASVMALGFFALPAYLGAMSWDKTAVKAPEYKLLSPQGDTLRSQDYAGKVVVMDFWATWCGPCKAQFPDMEKIYKRYKGNKQVVFLMITSIDKRNNFDKVQAFIKESSYDLPFVMDLTGASLKAFDVTRLPSGFIIDKKGSLRKLQTVMDKAQFYDSYCSQIDSLLARE